MSETPAANCTIHLNAPSREVARADRLAAELTRRGAGVAVPRAAIYRRALAAGLDQIEAELRAGAVERPPGESCAA